jgi:hypothetical protein
MEKMAQNQWIEKNTKENGLYGTFFSPLFGPL